VHGLQLITLAFPAAALAFLSVLAWPRLAASLAARPALALCWAASATFFLPAPFASVAPAFFFGAAFLVVLMMSSRDMPIMFSTFDIACFQPRSLFAVDCAGGAGNERWVKGKGPPKLQTFETVCGQEKISSGSHRLPVAKLSSE